MFSSLPKIADKTFVIAFLVPTLAFYLAIVAAFPQWAVLAQVEQHLASDKGLADLTLMLAGLWFSAVALMLVNRPLYRSLEGYVGPLAIDRFKIAMQAEWASRDAALSAQLAAARKLAGPARDDAAADYNRNRWMFRRWFPPSKDRVLGTRFGNINRAFEDYPQEVYGVDGVTIWPRLSAVIPAAFQTTLGDARAQVDCFLDLTVLAGVFAGLEALHWLWSIVATLAGFPMALRSLAHASPAAQLATLSSLVRGVAWDALYLSGASVGAAWLFYVLMLDRAIALGEQVKSAFDLYLGPLARQLGYQMPDKFAEQKALWSRLRRSYAYFDPAPQDHRLKTPPKPDPGPGATGGGGDDGADDEDKDD